MDKIFLTFGNEGQPIAKLYNKGKEDIISLVIPTEPFSHCKKKCCRKCRGDLCLGGCCKSCCNMEEIRDEDSSSDECSDEDYNQKSLDLDLLDVGYYRQMKLPFRTNIDKFKTKIINKEVKPKIYKATKKYIKYKKEREIMIYDGEIQPIPKNHSRECIYVAGPSGSGKSTYISNYAYEYKKMFPKNKIYVFSRVSHDEAIDKLNPVRIMINEEMIEDPINPDELANSLVIFDDTDTITDKNLRNAVMALKNDLLETGRHEDVYVAITSHLLSNYRETRTVLNECDTITLFPAAGSTYSMRYILKNYVGMDKLSIDKFVNLPSRWVTLKKTFPQLVIYSKGIYLLNKT
jgi:hypothetical protein